MPAKQAPKSCGCHGCRHYVSNKKARRKPGERAFRHEANQLVRMGQSDLILPAPHGQRLY